MKKFVDPNYWGEFFPRRAIETLKRFGLGFDRTRTYITTDKNPYYDSFVQWQFHHLKLNKMLKFGKRYDIYSVNDGQSCLAHDRSKGEDAKPFEHVLFKACLIETEATEMYHNPTYLMCMTMRPETLNGLSNIWINPKGTYQKYMVGDETWICQERNMISLKYQNPDNELYQNYRHIGDVKGEDFIGKYCTFKHAPDRQLPVCELKVDGNNMIDMKKGSGIVGSVPTDSPTDYLGVISHNEKQTDEFKIDLNNLMPIIKVTMNAGSLSSVTEDDFESTCIAKDLVKINSTRSKKARMTLDEMHDICYKKTPPKSILIVGPYMGMSVEDARIKIKQDYYTEEVAIPYYEPNEIVISRTGDECIVALTDQWFIRYGQTEMKDYIKDYVENKLETFTDSTKVEFQEAINWLSEWPCSRTCGLGTYIPFDKQYLIDSLSDSTIYMAFSTICNKLDQFQISNLTIDVWDYVFLEKKHEEYTKEEQTKYLKFKPLKEEFNYWYPVDLRVSAKDLIFTHLSMSLYNHLGIFGEKMIPKAYHINGYITLMNGTSKSKQPEKMAKSSGNFKTLSQALDIYTADSIRFTLAEGGDDIKDALFNQEICTKMVEKLYKEYHWIKEQINNIPEMYDNIKDDNLSFHDKVFLNEINIIISETLEHYNNMKYLEVVNTCFHRLQKARDLYRERQTTLKPTVIKRFIHTQIVLFSPICPHFCESIFRSPEYKQVIDDSESLIIASLYNGVYNAETSQIDPKLTFYNDYLSLIVHRIGRSKVKFAKSKKSIKTVTIYPASTYTSDNERMIYNIARNYQDRFMTTDKKELVRTVMSDIRESGSLSKKEVSKMMAKFNMIYKNVMKYDDWLTWIERNQLNESQILTEYLADFPIMKDISSFTVNALGHKDTEICNPAIVCE